MNKQEHKDSCDYAVDISKQFITLSVGTLGFVVGLLIINEVFFPKWVNISAIVALALSIASGILFLMSVVAHINQSNNYDVYTPCLRILAAAQIILFSVAIIIVGGNTLVYCCKKAKTSVSSINISIRGKTVSYPIFPGNKVNLRIDAQDNIEMNVTP